MLVRKDHFRASQIMQKRVKETKNISILYNSITQEVIGDDAVVTGVKVKNKLTNKIKFVESAGFEPASIQVIKLPSTSLFIFKFSRKYLVDNNQNIFLIT